MNDGPEDEVINTTHRYNHYCRAVNPENGKTCSLYSPHEPGHKPKHGVEADRWFD